MLAPNESEHTVSKRPVILLFLRLTSRQLMVVFTSICLCLLVFVFLLSTYQHDISYADVQRISSKRWSQTRPHTKPALEEGLGNTFIRHQYEEWLLLQQAGNKSFDLQPGSDFMKQQATIQRQRKRALQQVCEKHPELSDVAFNSWNTRLLFAAKKTRLLYCAVPKAGCTNWKKVLMVLEGQRKYVWNITGFEAHKRSILSNLSAVDQEEKEYILDNYVKFMYVRHPFIRLLSAYRNKIARDIAHQGKVFRGYARRIASKYRPGAPLEELKAQGNYNVTWDEWIAYLTDPSELDDFNQHWKEFYKMCFPCRIDYDFIGRLETVSADSAYMLSVLGFNKVSYPMSVQTSSSDLYDQYFANVSRGKLWKLWKIYALDFKLFGFPKPEILNKPNIEYYDMYQVSH